MKTIALCGNPNCGKTTLFNNLTGQTAHVGNWPGVTVDKKEGIYKKGSEQLAIIDLPGIYSLSPYTAEEVITRNYILEEKPDCVINVVDATNLERNLYLTTQLLEIDVPVIIALNMIDIVNKNGEIIDVEKLSSNLGVKVVSISALKNENIHELMEEVIVESNNERVGKTILTSGPLSHLITDTTAAFRALDIKNPLFHAIKLIENDEIETKNHKELVKIVDEFKKTFNDDVFGNDLEAIVADNRYKYITKHYACAKIKNERNDEKLTTSDKADKVLTHKWLGIPIFLCILFLIFHLTFSENLFYLGHAFNFEGPSFEGSFFEGLFYTEAGINSPGVILFNFLDSITSGLSDLAAGALANASGWVSGLIVDGVLAGIFAVLSFIPQILLLFLFFQILEDSGYMARIAFILDRIFRKFGLSGRAFLPMIMGFGCGVPAMINCRTLSDDREKTATIRVIPFFSCGAKLPILTAIAGGICVSFGFKNADIITYSMYLIGIVLAILSVILMRSTTLKGDVAPFIMELPSYHLPQFKSLMVHLWDKLKHYVKKAFTIILASTIVIWFLQSFTWNWKYIEQANVIDIANEKYEELIEDDTYLSKILALDEEFDSSVSLEDVMSKYMELEDEEDIIRYNETLSIVFDEAITEYKSITSDKDYVDTSDSILASLGKFVSPIFTPLGFGLQLNDNGWVFPVAAGTGLIAKENVIATFGVISQCISNTNELNVNSYMDLYIANLDEDGVSAATQMINNSDIKWPALIAFIVFNMTTIPCFASVATAKAELPEHKIWPTIAFWLGASYISAMVCYLVLSWWWTTFIILGIIVGLSFAIHYYNKYKASNKVAKI